MNQLGELRNGNGRRCGRCATGLDVGEILQGQGVLTCQACDPEGYFIKALNGNPRWEPSFHTLEAMGLAH